jgi:hypothetical protein
MMRSVVYETPENLEEAIYRARTCVSSPSQRALYPSRFGPGSTSKPRFFYFGSIEGVEESSRFAVDLNQVQGAEIPSDLEQDGVPFFEIRNCDDTTKIDEAIEKARSILASSPIHSPILDLFGSILYEAFNRTKKIEYLNESISVRRQANRVCASRMPSVTRTFLPFSVSAPPLQFFPSYRTQDLDEAMELLSQYVQHAHANLPLRFHFACVWALLARRFRHSSVSTAYETALLLMQDTVLFSPTLQLQHTTLATHDITQSLPLDYASYRVDHHQLEEAIEDS